MKSYYTIREFARENRKNPTLSEAYFWKKARGKKIHGLKFLRQHVIEYRLYFDKPNYFIANFYCSDSNLIVELDGRVHEYQKEYDSNRTEILNGLGINVIRFKNDEVLNDWDRVETKLLSFN